MKKGDKVTIYEDPITKERLEGEAILVKLIDEDCGRWEEGTMQRWKVRFLNEIMNEFERSILVKP